MSVLATVIHYFKVLYVLLNSLCHLLSKLVSFVTRKPIIMGFSRENLCEVSQVKSFQYTLSYSVYITREEKPLWL